MNSFLSDSSTPLYQQVYNLLRDRINTGEYSVGDRLPSEPELAEAFGVSRITLRTAVDKLTEDGLLLLHRGKGTFVAETALTDSVYARGSFTVSCQRQNVTPNTHIISVSTENPNENAARMLALQNAEKVIVIKRLRSINHKPAIFEIDYMPQARFADLLKMDLEERSLFAVLLEKFGLEPTLLHDEFSVRSSGIELSSHLDCPTSTALLWVGQQVCNADGIIYYNEQYIRSERYCYAIRSRLTDEQP